jgi:hypothetical protein
LGAPIRLARAHLRRALPPDVAHRAAAHRRYSGDPRDDHQRRSRFGAGLASQGADRRQANDATLAAKKDEAQAIGREAQAKVAAEAVAHRAAAEQKLAQALAAAEQRIAAEKAEKMAQVESVAKDAAAAIVAKLTGASADAAAIEAAVRSLSAR